ncbi:MAG TPA: type ISP restriction/modification enzyme [Thermoanaerobaculia bacterium]|nr:type ISP restriction/modification enzyme [Thermoanaerobaculia bacterium]
MPASPSAIRPLQAQRAELFQEYLERISGMERREEAREESFYSLFAALLEGYGEHRGWQDLQVLILPRKTDGCLLDLQVRRGERIAGYVEAKPPGTDLTRAAGTDQLKRYCAAFPNLLLTNFRELRLYRGKDLAARAEIGRGDPGPLLDLFCDFAPPATASAAELASRMALRARLLAVRLHELLKADAEGTSELAGFYRAFSKHLVAGLDREEFANLYAQTLAYGLLAARWQARGPFDRRIAAESIPATSGLLRDAFRYISLADPPREVAWIVDEIVDLLAHASVYAMLERSVRRGRDPVLDFYETFLHWYDAGLRRRRGVYYTPPELVSYVVRSVHRLLQTRLGRRDGLADPTVTLLDPAAGTLTFVVEAIRCAVAEARSSGGGGVVPALVGDHLLRDFHAFELMMAPYAVGHLKMSLILEELGRPLSEGERVSFYLTNTLEMADLEQSSLPGTAALARESLLAGRIKKEARITVVLGNPPWSGHSANRGTRLDGYGSVDGEPLREKSAKWLQNDYLKFLRFAQTKVEEAGEGIVALVTDHGYLDNPTFRGVRRSLLQTFDELYLLDLHGNGKKKERAPDGSADAGVFRDVRQGAAVAILVKRPGLPRRVARADLWGSRAAKLRWLEEHDVESTPWTEIGPTGPAFLFTPRDAALEREYSQGVPLPGIFPVHSAGIVTGRDAFAIDTGREELKRRIGRLRSETIPDEVVRREWGSTGKGRCHLAEARREIRKDPAWETKLLPILFHPFDRRTVFYEDYVIERPREAVMRHLLAPGSLGLVAPRQHKEEPGALVADTLVAHKAVSAFDINSVFPLYLHSEGGLYGAERKPNLDPGFLARMEERLGEEPSPELVLQYVYAVLYSPPYRRRYAALLRTDFPRIPLPPDRGAFLELAGLGAVLISLHLLASDRLDRPAVRFEEGSGMLDGHREFREGRLIVNAGGNAGGQALTGISREVWDYRIGGYQVLDRWLAGRAGRALRHQEIEDFRRIAEALRWTVEYQRRIGLLWGAAFQGSWGQECLG